MNLTKRSFFLFGLLASMSAFPSEITLAQGNSAPVQRLQKPIHVVVDPEGWTIPTKIKAELISDEKSDYQGTELILKTFKPNAVYDEPIVLYSLNAKNEIVKAKKYVEVRSFSSWATRRGIFAYVFDYLQVGVSEKAGRAYFGPPIRIAIVDEDGDGIFETRIYYPVGNFDRYPEWIMK